MAAVRKMCSATGLEAWEQSRTLIAGIELVSHERRIVATCASPIRVNLTTSRPFGQIVTSDRWCPMKDSNPQLVETYYPSGKIKSRGTRVDGQWDGLCQRWFESGGLFTQSEYRDGVMNGLLQEWPEDGVLTLSAIIRNGDYDGPYKSWWDSGLLKEEGTFRRGKRVGRYTWYKVDGSLWRSCDLADESSQ